MGKHCCVTNCKGNYDDKNKEKVFRLPRDEKENQRWRAAIPRDNIPVSKNVFVCERHWPDNYSKIKDYGKFRPQDPPSVFTCVKKSLIPTPLPPPRKTMSSSSKVRSQLPDDMPYFSKADVIPNFESLQNNINSNYKSYKLMINVTDEAVILQSSDFIMGTGMPRFVLKIDKYLKYEAFHCGVQCVISPLSTNKVTVLNRWMNIDESLRYLNFLEVTQKKDVLHQQLSSMGLTYVGKKKYSDETIIRAFEYFALSRSAYNRLREDFELPSVRTITRITSRVNKLDDNLYIQKVFQNLNDERQKTCILLLDEVYVKAMLQYHGGILFGKAVNHPSKLANTVLSFMVITLFGGPKFLCKMLPVCNLSANFVFEQTNLLLDAIKNAGGKVVATICDGNRVNQAFFKMFDTVSPWRTTYDMFLLFDYVHLFKCIRNNWITEKAQELEFVYEGEMKTAKWSDIKALYNLEKTQLIKCSKLVAVNPKPVERQRVSPCLQVFCDNTLSSLKSHPELQNKDGTVIFLSKIIEFWKIVNVHGPYRDVRLRDADRAAVYSAEDMNLQKLSEFSDFVEQYLTPSSSKIRVKKITKDTSYNIVHTCKGLVELAVYLLSLNHDYVCLGKYTTDYLEKMFGKLRQGSGGTYFITVQQVLEKVCIYKAKLLLQLRVDITDLIDCGHACAKCGYLPNEDICEMLSKLPELEKILPSDNIMAILYVAGYIVRKNIDDFEDTYIYHEKYGDFINDVNRGGLKIPGDSVCQWTIFSYIVFHEVVNDCCRTSLCNLLMMIAEFYSFDVSRQHGIILSNILFNNYCVFCILLSTKEPKQKVLKLSTEY